MTPYESFLKGHEFTQNRVEIVHGRCVFTSNTRPRPLRFIILPFINPLMNCINLIALLYKAIISGRSNASKNAKDTLQLGDIKEGLMN